ncbi:hypothetical protein BDB00DRAFT_409852 [Zychaea mexicana]|uniref:uncharacterized protein n=1 Tax=Zychaea mexicana TaxID=64656 RepID=UPI0022FE981A|nr:uncharacterized protein BDB00DRAFT_409852 [Zychaea mexicana]KAI9492982.1 hypothetical protein BDB00DRAFT_409852 [Zychaea mexicana]
MENTSNTKCKHNRRYGLTGTAFACCLADLHLQIQHSLGTVFAVENDWTVLKVYHHVSTLANVVNRLAHLVHLDGVAAPVEVRQIYIVSALFYKTNFFIIYITRMQHLLKRFEICVKLVSTFPRAASYWRDCAKKSRPLITPCLEETRRFIGTCVSPCYVIPVFHT